MGLGDLNVPLSPESSPAPRTAHRPATILENSLEIGAILDVTGNRLDDRVGTPVSERDHNAGGHQGQPLPSVYLV